MDPGKIIQYLLRRRVNYVIQNGAYFEDLKGNVTGFLIDYEFEKLTSGVELRRKVWECDGAHSVKMSDEGEVLPLYQRIFFTEEAGLVKDDEMLAYPFDHDERISLKMIRNNKGKLLKGEVIDLIIKTAENG